MSDYISRQAAIDELAKKYYDTQNDYIMAVQVIGRLPTADVVEADKAQKEIDFWHDIAQSYEQTILKLSLNKADVVEVVRCKDCKHRVYDKERGWLYCSVYYGLGSVRDNNYCSFGERRSGKCG